MVIDNRLFSNNIFLDCIKIIISGKGAKKKLTKESILKQKSGKKSIKVIHALYSYYIVIACKVEIWK